MPPLSPSSYSPNNADEFPVFREITQLENEENRLAFHNCLIKNSLITDEISSENKYTLIAPPDSLFSILSFSDITDKTFFLT